MLSFPDSRGRRRLAALGALLAAGTLVVLLVAGSLGSAQRHRPVRPRQGTALRPSGGRERRSAKQGNARERGALGPPRPAPILMYHVVSDPLPGSPYPSLYVPRAELADQMQALKRAGYTAITLQQLWDSWHAHGPLPRRPIVLSFDDGYHSHVANALPVLRALGWPGVLNLELNNIRSDYGLTAAQVRELIAAGWELDSHTIDHPDLTTVDTATLAHEVVDSRAELRRRFGVPANFFCYPAGRYDAAAIAAVRAAGYLAATTTEPGLAEPDEAGRFTLHRVRVNGGTSGATLVGQLAALSR